MAMAVEPPRAPGAAGMAMGSAAGLLALLDEESPSLQAEALARLDATVATSWFEARPPPAPAPAVAGTDPRGPRSPATCRKSRPSGRTKASPRASARPCWPPRRVRDTPPRPAPAPDMKGKTPGHRG